MNNLGTGVYDFFYLPASGITRSPREFGEGLAKGVFFNEISLKIHRNY